MSKRTVGKTKPAAAKKVAAAPPPTVLVVTPPGWSASTSSGGEPRPIKLSLDDIHKAAASASAPKKARPKLKTSAGRPAKARSKRSREPSMTPRWTLVAWLGAAVCVVLAALRLGDPERGAWVLGYLVVAGLLVVVAAHRPIGRLVARVFRGSGRGPARPPRKRSRGGRQRA